MVASQTRSSSATNVVEGFSQRFNHLMDRARFPRENRVSLGSKRFKVVHNTFKGWCSADKIPGSHSALVEIVDALLKDIPGRHNPRAIIAWLLAGDAVPNPFGDETDALALVELYLQISDVAKREGVDFDTLPREVRNVILRHARAKLPPDATHADGGLQLDSATLSMVVGMLATARTLT